jgi:hypothetical protein
VIDAKALGKKRRRQGAGFSMRSFSEHLDLPIGQVRRAVKNGEIVTVRFAGQDRIPPSEAERIKQLFGLKGCDPGVTKGISNGFDHEDSKQERDG